MDNWWGIYHCDRRHLRLATRIAIHMVRMEREVGCTAREIRSAIHNETYTLPAVRGRPLLSRWSSKTLRLPICWWVSKKKMWRTQTQRMKGRIRERKKRKKRKESELDERSQEVEWRCDGKRRRGTIYAAPILELESVLNWNEMKPGSDCRTIYYRSYDVRRASQQNYFS